MAFIKEKKTADLEFIPAVLAECMNELERSPVGVMAGGMREESRNSGNI